MSFQKLKRLDKYEELTPKITGHIVEFPKKFLHQENLKFKILQAEKIFLPEEVFT